MKMLEEIKHYKKEFVYENYTRIVDNFKDYDKITKVKMIEDIYKVYSDYNNIIDICTTRELKYLKMLLDNNLMNYLDDKYAWERRTLSNKFLIEYDFKDYYIPEEILEYVEYALKHVNWKEKKKIDELNEILVSYCKIEGSALLFTVTNVGAALTGTNEELVWNHLINNKLFNYYVFITSKDIDDLGSDIPVAIYQDFLEIEEALEEERKQQGVSCNLNTDINYYKTIFYNDFDINNPKIKKFLKEIKELPFFWEDALKIVREFAMLNYDRTSLKASIKNVPNLQRRDLTKFLKTLDDAMDEMPSGALNGLTPNEAKIKKIDNLKRDKKKEEEFIKQENACLSSKDKDLFYKIYFALLEFTNKKYNIIPNLKLYKKHNINPYLIKDIVDKFWEDKEKIVLEFSFSNPYKFTKEELELTRNFSKGIRGVFIIVKYDYQYTHFMCEDRIYMVKGLNSNIDEVVSYDELPSVVITSLIPFKDNLVYDGMILSMNVNLGKNFIDIIESEYNTLMKYYHL